MHAPCPRGPVAANLESKFLSYQSLMRTPGVVASMLVALGLLMIGGGGVCPTPCVENLQGCNADMIQPYSETAKEADVSAGKVGTTPAGAVANDAAHGQPGSDAPAASATELGGVPEIRSGETKTDQTIPGPPFFQHWAFEGSQDDGVIINAVTILGKLDTAIDLYAPDGTLETRGWQTGSGGDVLEYRLKKTGKYTLKISDYGMNDTGTYNLTLLRIPVPTDPNAGMIVSGQTFVKRCISHAADLEAFQFQGKATEGIIINAVKTAGDLDTAIDLFAPDGTLETRGWQTGSGGDSVEYRLRQTGLYTIVIKDYGVDHCGTYNLTFLKIPGSVTHADDPDGGTIAFGQTVNPGGTINAPSDIDAFQFYGEKDKDHVIINAVTLAGDLDTAIDLFAPDGGLEVRGWQTGSGGDTLDWWPKKTGVYTIVIKDYGLDATGRYWISLTRIPAVKSTK